MHHLEDSSSKITNLAKSRLEALLSGQYQEEENTFKPRLKKLALQRVWLEETGMEQEKGKRAITDSMAGLCAQLNDWDIKTPLEAKSVRRVIKGKEQQQPLLSTSHTKDAQLLPQVPPSLLDSTVTMGKVMDPPNLSSLPGTRGDLVSADGKL